MKSAFAFILFLSSCLGRHQQESAPSHEIYSQLLSKHVSREGQVDYNGFISDSLRFRQYLSILSNNPPNDTWSREEQMAYWINAYNAFTISLVARYYPIGGIKEIGSSIQIPFVNTPWDIKFIMIGDKKMDLNNIEHGILRRKFHDARVHMALVCASKSCPILLNEAYVPERLDAQLARQSTMFLSDPFRNIITPEKAMLNMIFNWYSSDFKRGGATVNDFINTYSKSKINDNTTIGYLEYDWNLNDWRQP